MSKPVKKSVAVWDDDTIDSLKGEFRCTDWDVFINNCTDMSELYVTQLLVMSTSMNSV